eukprot:sb/3465133/
MDNEHYLGQLNSFLANKGYTLPRDLECIEQSTPSGTVFLCNLFLFDFGLVSEILQKSLCWKARPFPKIRLCAQSFQITEFNCLHFSPALGRHNDGSRRYIDGSRRHTDGSRRHTDVVTDRDPGDRTAIFENPGPVTRQRFLTGIQARMDLVCLVDHLFPHGTLRCHVGVVLVVDQERDRERQRERDIGPRFNGNLGERVLSVKSGCPLNRDRANLALSRDSALWPCTLSSRLTVLGQPRPYWSGTVARGGPNVEETVVDRTLRPGVRLNCAGKRKGCHSPSSPPPKALPETFYGYLAENPDFRRLKSSSLYLIWVRSYRGVPFAGDSVQSGRHNDGSRRYIGGSRRHTDGSRRHTDDRVSQFRQICIRYTVEPRFNGTFGGKGLSVKSGYPFNRGQISGLLGNIWDLILTGMI